MGNVDPIKLYNEIKERYLSFVLTTTCRNNSRLYGELKTIFENNELLWRDLILQAVPQYTQSSQEELKSIGFGDDFCNYISDLFYDVGKYPYGHQIKAWGKIREGDNCIISTGTGSGKTEGFLIPIIEHCVKNPHQGVQTIIVYPLKALANDQGKRIGAFLDTANSKFNMGLTFGIFDGDTGRRDPFDCDSEICSKDEMLENPPNILITNYVMLERILLHPKYSKLLNNSKIKFIVLDEIHYYRGAQGIDVSLLLRRLQFSLSKFEEAPTMQYLGTSATLSTDTESCDEVLSFLKKLYNQNFNEDDVVGPTYSEDYGNNDFFQPTLLSDVNDQVPSDIQLRAHAFFCSPPSFYRCLSCGEVHIGEISKCPHCDSTAIFEIMTCRQCGQEYFSYTFSEPEGQRKPEVRLNDLDIIGGLKHFDKNNEEEDYGTLILSSSVQDGQYPLKLCEGCLSLNTPESKVCSFCKGEKLIQVTLAGEEKEMKQDLSSSINDRYCPKCDYRESQRPLINPISRISDENASHIIFQEFFNSLDETSKKLLLFTDSVQRTSKFAREIEETYLKNVARVELQKEIESLSSPIRMSRLINNVMENLKVRTEITDYLAKTIEMELYEELLSNGRKVASLSNRGVFSITPSDLDSFEEVDREKILNAFEVFKSKKQVSGYAHMIDNDDLQLYNPFYDRDKLIEKIFRKMSGLKGKTLKNPDLSEAKRIVNLLRDNRMVTDENGRFFFKEQFIEVMPNSPSEVNNPNYYDEWKEHEVSTFLKTRVDTGKISAEERSKIESEFKNSTGSVNFLVSTPTLELGIDIGDLDVVGLLYSPPSPAQYSQRVGRSGRAGQSSLAVTYLSQRALDSMYFSDPKELVSGNIKPPPMAINLATPLKKSLFSVFLGDLLAKDDFISLFRDWKNIESWENNFEKVKDYWVNSKGDYDSLFIDYLNHSQITLETSGLIEEWVQKLEEYIKLRRSLHSRSGENTDIFNYLQQAGLLPDYAFGTGGPIVLVQNFDPISGFSLREASPPSTIDHNKNRYSCRKADMNEDRRKLVANDYKRCLNCEGVINISSDGDSCPICNGELSSQHTGIITPRIIWGKRSTFSLQQKRVIWDYVVIDLPENLDIPERGSSKPFTCDIGMLFSAVDYNGVVRTDFKLCNCGHLFSLGDRRASMGHTHSDSGLILGEKFNTRAVAFDFSSFEEPDLTTLKNAIISAATYEAGCEDGEINAVILDGPSKIIFFDAIEGGVGFVDVLCDKYDKIISIAKDLCKKECCEHGCIKCIGSYRRQNELRWLNKKDALSILKNLSGEVEVEEVSLD